MPSNMEDDNRVQCIHCREWNLPTEMFNKRFCKYCIKEKRIINETISRLVKKDNSGRKSKE